MARYGAGTATSEVVTLQPLPGTVTSRKAELDSATGKPNPYTDMFPR